MPDVNGNWMLGEVLGTTQAELEIRRRRYEEVARRHHEWLESHLRAMQGLQSTYSTRTGLSSLGPPIPILPQPNPQPTLPLEEYVSSSKVANSFLVGCDPEMVIVKDGRILNVSGYMPERGEVGYDHGGFVVELRPKPAKSTYTLTKRLGTLIKKSPQLTQFESERWKSGAIYRTEVGDRNRVTLGGHVHLDIKPERIPEWDDPGQRWYYENHYTPALDRVTRYFEHLDLLPKNESESRRLDGNGYGRWGDVRTDLGRLEYRTMASWLYNPKTTFLCLTGAKLAGVDPVLTLDSLPLGNISFPNLTKFYENFKEKDTDAARVCEEILAEGQKKLMADPDKDVKGEWR